MKLTKSEQKIISIKRAIREGNGVFVIRKDPVTARVKCSHCKGDYTREIDGFVYRCKYCNAGVELVKAGYKEHVVLICEGDISIPTWNDEPITFGGYKLKDIYITRKGAERSAKAQHKKGASK